MQIDTTFYDFVTTASQNFARLDPLQPTANIQQLQPAMQAERGLRPPIDMHGARRSVKR
jgi:hypothetical protein